MVKRAYLKSQVTAKGLVKPYSGKKLLEFCHNLSNQLLLDILQQAGLSTEQDCATLARRSTAEGLGFFYQDVTIVGKEYQLISPW